MRVHFSRHLKSVLKDSMMKDDHLDISLALTEKMGTRTTMAAMELPSKRALELSELNGLKYLKLKVS